MLKTRLYVRTKPGKAVTVSAAVPAFIQKTVELVKKIQPKCNISEQIHFVQQHFYGRQKETEPIFRNWFCCRNIFIEIEHLNQ